MKLVYLYFSGVKFLQNVVYQKIKMCSLFTELFKKIEEGQVFIKTDYSYYINMTVQFVTDTSQIGEVMK